MEGWNDLQRIKGSAGDLRKGSHDFPLGEGSHRRSQASCSCPFLTVGIQIGVKDLQFNHLPDHALLEL